MNLVREPLALLAAIRVYREAKLPHDSVPARAENGRSRRDGRSRKIHQPQRWSLWPRWCSSLRSRRAPFRRGSRRGVNPVEVLRESW